MPVLPRVRGIEDISVHRAYGLLIGIGLEVSNVGSLALLAVTDLITVAILLVRFHIVALLCACTSRHFLRHSLAYSLSVGVSKLRIDAEQS